MRNVLALAVNEIFGPTFQGEGPHLGHACVFLRLAGCNLACEWCDTPYSWDWARYSVTDELHRMTIDEVLAVLNNYEQRMVVITGGEPMLQKKALRELTRQLHADGWYTEIETAGTIAPDSVEMVKHFNVSPKLANSGNPLRHRYNPTALDVLSVAPSRAFKFVVKSEADFKEIDKLVFRHELSPVYIMPEGVSNDVISQRSIDIAPAVISRGYRLTTRLHVAMYGTRRGV